MKNSFYLIVGLVAVLIFCTPYFFSGKAIYLDQVDSLDSIITWYKVLKSEKAAFIPNQSLVDGMVGLQPRYVYPSEIGVLFWIFYLLPGHLAYSLNFTLVHITAFLSMFFLTKKVTEDYFDLVFPKLSHFIILIGALTFSFIPFWVLAGISSAGLPLMVLSILLINDGDYKKAYILTFIYGIYSSVFLSGMFVLIVYGFILIFLQIRQGSSIRAKHHFLNMIFLAVLYFLCEYRIMLSILDGSFNSHRSLAVNITLDLTFENFVSLPFKLVSTGHWHAGQLNEWILRIVLIGVAYLILTKNSTKSLNRILSLYFFILILTFFGTNQLLHSALTNVPILGQVQLDRFYFLIPFCTSFIIILIYLNIQKKLVSWAFIIFSILMILNYIKRDSHWISLLKKNLGREIEFVSYSDYYQEKLFSEIRTELERANYTRLVSIGIDPAIPIYNRINSADGYLTIYNTSSKIKMEQAIKEELAKNEFIAENFYSWGNRCYFYNSQIGIDYSNYSIDTIQSFSYDFSSLDISHLLSAYPIDNHQLRKTNMTLVYSNSQNSGNYFIYQLN